MSQPKINEQLIEKWQPLLEGCRSDWERHTLATLLENQYREAKKHLMETTQTTEVDGWNLALPIVRRVFANLRATDLVSVQPLSLPTGLVFYLDFKSPDLPGNSSVYGGTGLTTDTATGGLYDENARLSRREYQTTITVDLATAQRATMRDVGFDTSIASLVSGGAVYYVDVPVASLPGVADVNTVRFWQYDDASGDPENTIAYPLPRYNRIVGAVGSPLHARLFFVTGSDFAAVAGGATTTQDLDLVYYINARNDFEDQSTDPDYPDLGFQSLDIPEINLELRSRPVATKTRKLRAAWTPEAMQDLAAYHKGVDLENEIVTLMSQYIAREIDLEILSTIMAHARRTDNYGFWSEVVGEYYNETLGNFVAGNFYGSKQEWLATLMIELNKVSNRIQQKTAVAGANFLVTSPQVAALLESMPGFTPGNDNRDGGTGIFYVGMVQGRYRLYKNIYQTQPVIILGNQDLTTPWQTGAIYAPYVPLLFTPTIVDPVNFSYRRGLMTRYALEVVRPEFYGLLYVKLLQP
jgi:hypothetical protein